MDSCSLICLAWFLISWNGLSDDLTGHISLLFLYDDTSGVSNVWTEELLTHSQQSNTGGATESDIHYSWKELVVAVEESIVECNTHLISIKRFILGMLLQVLSILFEHVSHLRLEMLGQLFLEEITNLFTMLAVSISYCKEMRIFKSTKMRHRDPHVLIDFIRITWWNTSLRSECKLCNRVGIHLFWIARVIGIWSEICWIHRFYFFITWSRGLRSQSWWRLRDRILTFVDGHFIIEWLRLLDTDGGLVFLAFKLLGSIQLLRILLTILSRYYRSRLLLVEVWFWPLMGLLWARQLVIALRLFLLAEALLDLAKVVIRLTSALLLAIKDLRRCAIGCRLNITFFLRIWKEVIVFITWWVSRLLFGSLRLASLMLFGLCSTG